MEFKASLSVGQGFSTLPSRRELGVRVFGRSLGVPGGRGIEHARSVGSVGCFPFSPPLRNPPSHPLRCSFYPCLISLSAQVEEFLAGARS